MPTKKEREYYRMGFQDGQKATVYEIADAPTSKDPYLAALGYEGKGGLYRVPKPKRKLNSWQKFVKANSKKRKFRFKDGKLKLKSMGIAYRKTAAYKRSKK